ncbi:MAG: HPr family phosphocarrier protein [Gammaproteobacteria bacterium]|nr:HPr family phosphocarrier protein [Gammaproteobacteria bacterium]NNJ73306.1 HPr family phosphocarrier protein [Enterobacterales bacterium]
MTKSTDNQHEREYEVECQLINSHGIHIRTAAMISEICERFDATVIIKSARAESDGRDMMRLLMLEATCGTALKIMAKGIQAEQAVLALQDVINSGFNDMDMT